MYNAHDIAMNPIHTLTYTYGLRCSAGRSVRLRAWKLVLTTTCCAPISLSPCHRIIFICVRLVKKNRNLMSKNKLNKFLWITLCRNLPSADDHRIPCPLKTMPLTKVAICHARTAKDVWDVISGEASRWTMTPMLEWRAHVISDRIEVGCLMFFVVVSSM